MEVASSPSTSSSSLSRERRTPATSSPSPTRRLSSASGPTVTSLSRPPPILTRNISEPNRFGVPDKDLPNMFHFGDVLVGNHPDTAPVPMVIPLAYLFPLPSLEPGNSKNQVLLMTLSPVFNLSLGYEMIYLIKKVISGQCWLIKS